jgi:hypothetical protein
MRRGSVLGRTPCKMTTSNTPSPGRSTKEWAAGYQKACHIHTRCFSEVLSASHWRTTSPVGHEELRFVVFIPVQTKLQCDVIAWWAGLSRLTLLSRKSDALQHFGLVFWRSLGCDSNSEHGSQSACFPFADGGADGQRVPPVDQTAGRMRTRHDRVH